MRAHETESTQDRAWGGEERACGRLHERERPRKEDTTHARESTHVREVGSM